MNISLLLSVRMQSSRLPGKALLPIEGKSLIEHVFDRLKQIPDLNNIVLCTTEDRADDPLVELADSHSIAVFRGHPTDVLDRFFQAARKFSVDVIVRATGDNPLTCPKFAAQAIAAFLEAEVDFCLTKQMPAGTKVEVISFDALERAQQSVLHRADTEYLTYVFDQPDYFKVLELDVEKEVRRPELRLTVDTQEDLNLMREIFRRLPNPQDRLVSRVISLLDSDPELLALNAGVLPKGNPGTLRLKREDA